MPDTRNGKIASWIQWAIVLALSIVVVFLAEARVSGRDGARLDALEKWQNGYSANRERLIRVEMKLEYVLLSVDEIKVDLKAMKEN